MSEFWSNFFANLLSDLIAGVILGTFLAWWVGKRLNELERSQQHQAETKANLSKAVIYLEFLKKEIDLFTQIGKDASKRGPMRFNTPYWDVLQPSGELPKLLNPTLLSLLANFYSYTATARKASDLALEDQIYLKLQREALQAASELGKDLLSKIDLTIQAIRTQLETL